MKCSSSLDGRGVSEGEAEGVVHLVTDPTAGTPTDSGGETILVAPYFTPVSLPAFIEAGGIVTDRGGTTSHAAIIARELGIPAVTAVETATEELSDDDRVRIDGSEGTVCIVNDD